MLQHAKRQVELFEMHCFTMLITALRYFSYEILMAEEQESFYDWYNNIHEKITRF